MNDLLKDNIAAMQKHSEISGFYTGLNSLLEFDTRTSLASKGIPYRNKMSGFVAAEQLKHQTSSQAKALIEYFENIYLEDEIQQAMFRELKREYDLNIAVPPEKIAQLTSLTSEAQAVWKEAYKTSNYSLFKPYLEMIINLTQEIAELVNLKGHPLDSLVAKYEPGIDVDNVTKLFQDLKIGIFELLKKIKKSQNNITDEFLSLKFDKKALFEFVKHMVETMGYDAEAGGYQESLHPFSVPVGHRDARIVSNYSEFKVGVFSGIHEAGHGIYMQNSDKALINTCLWGGISGAMHEGQARFYQNFLGKSRSFWEYFFPEAQDRFDLLSNLNLDQFYKGINRVTPSLRRTTADEVTYNLHVIIRFEIEKDILEGKINVNELPDLWNAKYKEVLGIEPSNDQEGILQDIHWAMGLMGYFQSYALGNLYSGQFLHQMKQDCPDAIGEIAFGNFKQVNSWLIGKIHKHGCLYTPDELVKKVTGQELSARYFLDYLEEKYSKIYEF